MAAKKNTKKAAPKKAVAKKKPAAKKPVKKAPAKKKPVAKKPVKKAAAKKPVKKAVAKKPVAKKPIKKIAHTSTKLSAGKKVVAKKPVKKAAPKKVVAKVVKKAVKTPVKPVAKTPVKVVAKTPEKETKAAAPMKMAMAKKPVAPEAVKPAEAPAKKPVIKMASAKPEKKPNTGKLSPFSQPADIKALAAMNKTFKIPLAKPNVMKTDRKVEIDSRSRYSDAELAEFKAIINGKLAEARKDLEMLRGSLSHTDDHGTDDTSPTFKMMEDGSETLSREETAQLAGRQEKFIMALENALIRIENKTYGICRVTGHLISKERLKLVPHTTLSIEAKNMQD